MNKAPETASIDTVEKSKRPVRGIILTWTCRLIFGMTFILSGFVKAVDPWGTVYKLQEYFDVLHLEQFSGLCVPFAFLLFTIEFLIGVFILTGCYRRLSVVAGAAFMAFMLPLTFWIMISNPIADCGCFGDAIPISNTATFWKNVILTLLAAWLLLHNRSVKWLITPALQWIAFTFTALFIIMIGWIGYNNQPLVDFRPYPTGISIATSDAENATDESANYLGIYEKDGETIKLPLDSIPDDGWKFVRREIIENKDIKNHKDTNAGIFDADDDSDVTSELILDDGKQILIFFNSLRDVSVANFYRINSLYNYCLKHNLDMSAIASATSEEIEEFRDLSLAEFPIYLADESWIKEVVRGNPGVICLKDGKIVWKSTLTAMRPDDFMSDEAPSDPELLASDNSLTLQTLVWSYVSLMAILMLLSMIPSVIDYLGKKKYNRFIKSSRAAVLFTMIIGLSSCSETDEPVIPSESFSSATLIYMVANNSLASDSNNDISEILKGAESIDLSSNAIIIYISSPTYSAGLYQVVKDKSDNCSLSKIKSYSDTYSSVDEMRISEVMEDFTYYYPSGSYGLFLWSHATGWLPSYNAIKKSFGDDNGEKINIENLAEAIPEDVFGYIWFDCCLMGGIESCFQLRDKTEKIVCSPTEIMKEGAPYDRILPVLCSSSPNLISAAEEEYDYYLNEASSSLGFTIAVVDCSLLEELSVAAHDIIAPEYPYIPTTSLQTYGAQTLTLPDGSKVRVSFYDLGDVFEMYARERNRDASDFIDILERAVIYKAATAKFSNITINPDKFSGLSVYVPLSPEAYGYNAAVEEYYFTLAWPNALIDDGNGG